MELLRCSSRHLPSPSSSSSTPSSSSSSIFHAHLSPHPKRNGCCSYLLLRICLRSSVCNAAETHRNSRRSRPALFVNAILVERPAPIEAGKSAAVEAGFIDHEPLKPVRKADASSTEEMGLTDTSLESTWAHRAWVSAGCVAMAGMMWKSFEASQSIDEGISSMLAALVAYILADLGTGVYHWGVDNYGDSRTPLFGPQIDAFQGHHKRPWTITKRQFANNIHALARPASFTLLPFLLLPSHAQLDAFLGVFLACVVFSQQFHSWAHSKKKDLPPLVVTLQDMGVLVSRKMHGAHHRSPYNINYCIVSGIWNPLLNKIEFFEKLERFIYMNWKIRPRSWGDTSVDWLQEGSYFSDGTNFDDHPLH